MSAGRFPGTCYCLLYKCKINAVLKLYEPIWLLTIGITILNMYRDLAEFSMPMNLPPPVMSREEFEARKADLRRKREMERRGPER